MGMRPGWVGGLVEESFFVACEAHESRKKNEKNIFCLACCTSVCPHCANAAHRHHPLLQARLVYNSVKLSCHLSLAPARWCPTRSTVPR
uniref:Uncharacterized protein n=1 Tax=Avena sativa TaxID=4498 RepID=A0ACD5UIC3_AVESA